MITEESTFPVYFTKDLFGHGVRLLAWAQLDPALAVERDQLGVVGRVGPGIAAGEADSADVRAGIDYLLSTQAENGAWNEEPFTGTGFPKVFYLKYHLYSVYFPLMAIGRFAGRRSN